MLIKVAKGLIVTLISLSSLYTQAADIQIFEVKKTLPLTNDEPVYHDFYINAGNESGLKPGMLITVFRREALYDTYRSRSPGELKVPVGRIKVIHVQKGLSVARVFSKISRKNTPILDYNYIMIGDQLDLSTAKMAPKKSRTRKSAQVAPSQVNRPSESFLSTLEMASQSEKSPVVPVSQQL